MGKTDWASVSLSNSLMMKLDESLKSDKTKELGVTSRAQIITLLIRKFLNNELNIDENSSKNEINEVRKIKKEIEEMKEEIKIDKNTGENLLNTAMELIEGKFQEIKNLTIKISDNEKILLHDPSLKNMVKLTIDEDGLLYCLHHKANYCYHISFISMNYVNKGFRALKEKHNKQ